MAVNISMLKKPLPLAVLGIATVGGIYVASKMRPGASNSEEPQEQVIRQENVSLSDTNRLDELQRMLTEKEAEFDRLTDAAKKEREDYQNTLSNERGEYEQRLRDEKGAISTQFEASIALLRSEIERLRQSIANTPKNEPPPIGVQPPDNKRDRIKEAPILVWPGAGRQQPGLPPDQPAATPPDQPRGVKYPGLPDNYVHNCTGDTARFASADSFDSALQRQRDEKPDVSNTFIARNMVGIAVMGVGDWTVLWYNTAQLADKQVFVNRTRVRNGLAPLSESDFSNLINAMRNGWNGDEKDTRFQSMSYARELYNQFNAPYHCSGGSSTIRRESR